MKGKLTSIWNPSRAVRNEVVLSLYGERFRTPAMVSQDLIAMWMEHLEGTIHEQTYPVRSQIEETL